MLGYNTLSVINIGWRVGGAPWWVMHATHRSDLAHLLIVTCGYESQWIDPLVLGERHQENLWLWTMNWCKIPDNSSWKREQWHADIVLKKGDKAREGDSCVEELRMFLELRIVTSGWALWMTTGEDDPAIYIFNYYQSLTIPM